MCCVPKYTHGLFNSASNTNIGCSKLNYNNNRSNNYIRSNFVLTLQL